MTEINNLGGLKSGSSVLSGLEELMVPFDCWVKQTSDENHRHHVLLSMSEQLLCFTASQWVIQDNDGRQLNILHAAWQT